MKPSFLWRAALSFGVLCGCALAMTVVAVPTLGRRRRFYSERIATPCGRLILRIWNVRLEMPAPLPYPGRQVVYVSNHTSTVDLFALIAAGLPDTRFFLSGYLRRLLPMGIVGTLIGVFWTVPQQFPARRRQIFRRACETLRRTGESVYLSPEGTRVTTGRIGPFNKGAFHLATALGAPIVPLYIEVPRAVDPGRSLDAGAGTVRLLVGMPFETADWALDDVVANKERVRDYYLRWQQELQGAAAAPSTEAGLSPLAHADA